jgi:hypothetical protein
VLISVGGDVLKELVCSVSQTACPSNPTWGISMGRPDHDLEQELPIHKFSVKDMNRLVRSSSAAAALANRASSRGGGGSSPLQQQPRRPLYFAIPVLLPIAVGAFVGITFYQVYKKRQAGEQGQIQSAAETAAEQARLQAEAHERVLAQQKALERAQAQKQAQGRAGGGEGGQGR